MPPAARPGGLDVQYLAEFEADLAPTIECNRAQQPVDDAKRRLESNYIDPLNLTAAGFAALVKADAIKWERIVRLTAARLN